MLNTMKVPLVCSTFRCDLDYYLIGKGTVNFTPLTF